MKSSRNYRGLSMEEARKSRIIHEAEELGISTRQVRRLIKKMKKEGELGLIHGLVGKKSNYSFSEEKDKKIL